MLKVMTDEQIKFMAHGMTKNEIVNRQADSHGGAGDSILTTPSGMSGTNPFKSDKQRAYLAINKPSVAKKFAAHKKIK